MDGITVRAVTGGYRAPSIISTHVKSGSSLSGLPKSTCGRSREQTVGPRRWTVKMEISERMKVHSGGK